MWRRVAEGVRNWKKVFEGEKVEVIDCLGKLSKVEEMRLKVEIEGS